MPRKLTVCILLFLVLLPFAKGQESSVLNKTISVRFKETSLPAALRTLSRLAEVNFSYNSNIVPRTKTNSSYFQTPLKEILEDLLELENLFYKEVGGSIVILKRRPTEKSIVGQVFDFRTKLPLQYANVFIGNSSLGIATDFNGNFKIDNVPDIRSELIVSHLGYRPKIIEFPFETERDTVQVLLEPEMTILDPVVVTARSRKKRDRQDRRLLKRFIVDFLGRSSNAKNSRIVNADVLDFVVPGDSTDNYTATAKEVLFIENRAMGYRISYRLEEFEFENGIVRKRGQAQFTELEPKSRKQNRRWENARKKAYLGSQTHFLNSLLEDRLFEEGFRVNVVRYDSANFEYSSPLNPPDLSEIFSLSGTDHLFQYKLTANFDVEITYQNEFEDVDYVKLFRTRSKSNNFKYTDRKSRTSIDLGNKRVLRSHDNSTGVDPATIPLFQKSVVAFINHQPIISYPGYFNNAKDAVHLGWWTWGGFSEALPLNYRPGK